MRKIRNDAKSINLLLAMKLHGEGGSLHQISKLFKVHHTNLIMRFKRFNVPIRSRTKSLLGIKKGPRPLRYSIDDKGYLVNNKTKARKHREIAEEILERPLHSHEVVHHWDKNGQNNEHSNLLICSKSYHSWLHAKLCDGLIGQNYKKEV